MHKIIFIVIMMFVGVASFSEEAAEDDNVKTLRALLSQVKSNGFTENKTHNLRETEFLTASEQQQRLLNEAQASLKKIRAETESLKKEFSDNEDVLTKLESEVVKRTGNLGEMFGVVRQVSQDVAAMRNSTLLSAFIGAKPPVLEELSAAKSLPDIQQLETLWYELQLQMTTQGESKQVKGLYVNGSGATQEGLINHVGPFVAFTDAGYLSFDESTGTFLALQVQPSESNLLPDYIRSNDEFSDVFIDPTKGALLSINSQAPSLFSRIKQGGLIGYIILIIGLSGVIYASFLLARIITTNSKVKAQLADIESINISNPLGRILAQYQNEKNDDDLESLEMKLDEAVLKELPSLEKGHSLIKLLAAVAPLLGLLGTVTGMIATFQSITLFGTGDPKLMASGISQALITTVLGLVAAIPLLFLHNILSSKSREVIQILDHQSAGLIAQKSQAVS